MNTTEGLEDHHPGILDEVIKTRHQEEIINQHCLTITQFLLGPIKIEVDIQILNETRYGVLIGVGFLLDDLYEVLHNISPGALVSDDSGGEVSEDPGASGLDCVQIRLLVEEQIYDQVSSLGVVEEDKQAPVDQPGALLKCLEITTESALINEGLQPVEILQCSVPVLHEDLGSKLAPHAVQVVPVSGLDQDTVEVEILTRTRVISTLVLELGKVVEDVEIFWFELVIFLQRFEELATIARILNLFSHVGILENLRGQ